MVVLGQGMARVCIKCCVKSSFKHLVNPHASIGGIDWNLAWKTEPRLELQSHKCEQCGLDSNGECKLYNYNLIIPSQGCSMQFPSY